MDSSCHVGREAGARGQALLGVEAAAVAIWCLGNFQGRAPGSLQVRRTLSEEEIARAVHARHTMAAATSIAHFCARTWGFIVLSRHRAVPHLWHYKTNCGDC